MKGGPQEGACVEPARDGKEQHRRVTPQAATAGGRAKPPGGLGTQGRPRLKAVQSKGRTLSPYWHQGLPNSLGLPQADALNSECRATGCLQPNPSLGPPHTQPNHQDPAPALSAYEPSGHHDHRYRDRVLSASSVASMPPYVALTTSLAGRIPSGLEGNSGSTSKSGA